MRSGIFLYGGECSSLTLIDLGSACRDRHEYIPVGSEKNVLFFTVPTSTSQVNQRRNIVPFTQGFGKNLNLQTVRTIGKGLLGSIISGPSKAGRFRRSLQGRIDDDAESPTGDGDPEMIEPSKPLQASHFGFYS